MPAGEGLRRRGARDDDWGKDKFKVPTSSLAKNFKKLDMFSKVQATESRSTNVGGAGTLQFPRWDSSRFARVLWPTQVFGSRLQFHL